MGRRNFLLLLLLRVSFASIASANPVSPADLDVSANVLTWHLNMDVIAAIGLRIAIPEQVLIEDRPDNNQGYLTYAFRVDSSGLSLPLDDRSVLRTAHGNFLALGGLLFMAGTQPVDLRSSIIRPHNEDLTRWDIADRQGVVWLSIDHAHPTWDALQSQLTVRHADLRLATAFAERMGHLDWADSVIGGADFSVTLKQNTAPQLAPPIELPAECKAPWSDSEHPAKIRLILNLPTSKTESTDTIAFERCQRRDPQGHVTSCNGTTVDGHVVFSPDASLRNVGTSSVAWYGMLTGSFPPYQNDQHPFLIWNLYRIDPDGQFRQLGRSGVKHAFYAINTGCMCPGGHVVYPHCEDTYSSYNNDSLQFVGPRDEVLPAKGLWGSCGSVFDSDCDGRQGPRTDGMDDGFRWRLSVAESELLPSLHPGAEYLFEYGYFVRDNDRQDAAIGYRIVSPKRGIGPTGFVTWRLDPTELRQGIALDRWVGRSSEKTGTMHRMFTSQDGEGSVAVRTIRLPHHRYRYLYAIMNLDLVHAQVAGSGSKLRVTHPHGIDQIEIPHAKKATLDNLQFFDVESDTKDHWVNHQFADVLTWTAAADDELTWGSVSSISIDSDTPPVAGEIRLRIGGDDHNLYVSVPSLVPGKRAQ